MDVDLVIRRAGTVVTADSRFQADIGVRGEKVVAIGGELHGASELDARGLHALPGAIDAHVHLTQAAPNEYGANWADDFTSGSEAALAGGVTTVGNMCFLRPGEAMRAGLAREVALIQEQAIADVILHPVIDDLRQAILDEIPALAAEGHTDIAYAEPVGYNNVLLLGGRRQEAAPATPATTT